MLKLIRNFNRNIHENIRENRRVFLLYTVLRVLVIVALVRAIMNGNYNGAFICLLSLGLFLPALAGAFSRALAARAGLQDPHSAAA